MYLTRDNHYIICLDFKFYQWYIIWIGDDVDGVVVDENLKILVFKTEAGLLHYWHNYIKTSNTEITCYDIYKIQQWVNNPYPKFDCNEFLNLWNLFTDIAKSTELQFIGDVKDEIMDAVYDKLFNASDSFWADELNPIFNAAEIDVLIKVMQNGLNLLLNNFSIIENEMILP